MKPFLSLGWFYLLMKIPDHKVKCQYPKSLQKEMVGNLENLHGYPAGMAQLIDSPTTFHIQPMQIDTKNRHYNGTDFKADILPKASAAPPNASYR